MSAILVKSFVGQAEAYFEKELTNERENYYSEKSTNVGQWTGKGAEALGLKGNVKKEDFSRISRGINPATGERFRRMTFGRTREVNGEITQVKEIAGWDMVISAPKSVSIAGLIGQDERVRIAHEESVTDALERAEQQAQSNNGGGKKEQTSNLIVGRFSHDSARPSKDGFVAPQLHDHCFIMNATLRADGTLKPLESLELHKAQSYIKSVYYTGLADRLQKLGYGVEIDRETGAPEITGISKEYRAACSPRRAEILDLAEKAGKNFRQLGLVNRREKIFDKDLIQEQHKGIDGIFDFQAERIVEAAKENPRPAGENSASQKEAKEAITFALAKLSERESVFEPRRILLEANKRGIGKTSVVAIEAELETRNKEEQVKTVWLSDGRKAAFLSSDEKIEAELPQHIKALKPQETLRDEILKTNPSDRQKAADEIEFRKLSDEQQKAVSEIMRARTGVVTLEGRAGVGKTTTLSFVNKIAEKADYEVLGLAPTTGAAQELDNAKITSSTLQKLLATQDAPRDHKRFFIVDESSFVSSRQMDKFFREAVKPNDRVLLVGDTRQHEGVEAGKPFARIQREELTTGAKVETIRRQTKATDRETVKNLSEGKIIEAVEAMHQRGQVVEVKDRAKRHNAIVEAFTSEPEKSLVVAPRNADRQEINAKIHEALKDAGKVEKAETEIKILRPRSELSGTEREFAAAYREGDIISYTRGSAENKIVAKSLAKVVRTDREQNLLTVEIKDARSGTEAREITYNPKRLRGVSVWTEEKIKVSTGDRLQLRAPFEEKNTKIANGTMLEVGEITPEAINLTTDKGKAVKLDTKRPHAIDYGYAVTSHSSQGKTIDRVLIHAETTESKQILNERMAYVAVSRARNEALIFTDDAQKLAFKMARQIEKTEITQTKAETVEHAPERAEKIVLDMKPELEKAERGEIKQPVISPPVEKLPTPRIEIEPAREKTIVVDTKPAILPAVEKSPTTEIQTAQPKTITAGDVQKNRQETLIEEVLQLSRNSLAKQDIQPNAEAWKRFANNVIKDLPNQKAGESQKKNLELLQEAVPQSERVSAAGKTSLEATHAILKSAPDDVRDRIIKTTLAGYEKQIIAERDEIKPLAVLPAVENPPTPEIKIQPAREKTIVPGAKPEVKKAEREEVEQPVILPETQILPIAEIKAQPQSKTAFSANDAKNRQAILVKEILQLSRDILAKQGVEPNAEAWKRYADDITNDAPNQPAHTSQISVLTGTQRRIPESERVNMEGASRLEATYLTLKLSSESFQKEFVENRLENYEREIKAEREEIKQPIQTAVEELPVTEIKTQQPERKIIVPAEAKNQQEILVKEVLQMSRDSLVKQGIEPKPEAWKQFAATVINDSPNNKANESQERILELLQKDTPQAERISLTEKTSLEATHAILKSAPEKQRGEIVKGTFANIEKEIAAERDNVVIKPEIKSEVKAERGDAIKPEIKVITPEVIETVKTTSLEKVAGEQVKPTLRVRDFAGVGREELISEVVAAARDEARAWTGEDLSYRQQKRLTKIYRRIGDTKPQEKQINDLKDIQERFGEPMPQPKTFLEATVLKLDNITDAEKSASLRGQIIKLDEFIKQDESAERESPTQNSWNVQPFFIREPNTYLAQQERQYFAQTAEAQNRNLVKPGDGREEMQKTIEQMQNANFLQDQIKRSLDEQGIKLEPLAQRIVNSTVDSYIKQPPTQQESAKVQEIAQSTGIAVNPVNKLEAVIYICHQDEQERDKTSYALASAATERADQIKAEQVITKEKTKDLEIEYENPTIGRSI